MLNDVKNNADQKMQKSLEALKANLGKIRTGRAHIGLLDHVMVEYYGSMVAVNQVANVTLGDAPRWRRPFAMAISASIRLPMAISSACRCPC